MFCTCSLKYKSAVRQDHIPRVGVMPTTGMYLTVETLQASLLRLVKALKIPSKPVSTGKIFVRYDMYLSEVSFLDKKIARARAWLFHARARACIGLLFSLLMFISFFYEKS